MLTTHLFGIFHRQTASLLKGHSIMIGYERGNPEKAQLLTSKYGTRFTWLYIRYYYMGSETIYKIIVGEHSSFASNLTVLHSVPTVSGWGLYFCAVSNNLSCLFWRPFRGRKENRLSRWRGGCVCARPTWWHG